MDKVYVLTESVSDYNQYGKYFLGVFKDIPTLEEVNACGLFILGAISPMVIDGF